MAVCQSTQVVMSHLDVAGCTLKVGYKTNVIRVIILKMSMCIFIYSAARNSNVIYVHRKGQSSAPTPGHCLSTPNKGIKRRERAVNIIFSCIVLRASVHGEVVRRIRVDVGRLPLVKRQAHVSIVLAVKLEEQLILKTIHQQGLL